MKVHKAKRIALIVRAPLHKATHYQLEDFGYDWANEKGGCLIYESRFHVFTKTDIARAIAPLKLNDIKVVEAYAFTRKSHKFVGGSND